MTVRENKYVTVSDRVWLTQRLLELKLDDVGEKFLQGQFESAMETARRQCVDAIASEIHQHLVERLNGIRI